MQEVGEINSRCRMFLYRNTYDSLSVIEKYFSILMRLRSAVGERGSGAENGEKRLAERKPERNVAAEPQTEARR